MERIINRTAEQAELCALAERGTHQLALLYGRRRVGKTHLLTNLWPETRAFYFTADNTTSEQNRATLVHHLGAWLGQTLHAEDYPTWRAVFRLLLGARAPAPLVVVLDEFQYLGEDTQGMARVASELNAVWEQRRPQRSFLLVLSGSAVQTLEALDGGAAPLYGRFSWKGKVEPFDYWHAAEMTPFRSLRDRVRGYAVFGGTPRYLAVIDAGASLGENVARLMLGPRGEVRALIETALVQEQGLRDIKKYQAILRAIGTGSTELSEIGGKAGLAADMALREKVERLVGLGYVRATRNIDARATAPIRYHIDDPAFAFYYEFVARYETALERNNPRTIWDEHIEPVLDGYLGHIFERIAEQAHRRLRARLRLPMVSEWGRWEGRDHAMQSLEMDVIAKLTDGRVMTGGVKWNRAPLPAKWHHHHMEMLERLAKSGVKWAHRALEPKAPLFWVAAGGFSKAFEQAIRAERRETYLWNLTTLYRKPPRRPRVRTGAR